MALREIFAFFKVDVDQRPLVELQTNLNRGIIRLNQLRRIAGFAFAALGAQALKEGADELINYHNRLRAVTESQEEFNQVNAGVKNIARNTRTSVADIAEVYQRYVQVTDSLGVSQQEVLGFTENLTKAMKVGGATQAEVRGVLIQFGQAIGNNFSSAGQEMNSIMEQSPLLAKILAESAGGTRGQLKRLVREGKITAKGAFDAVMEAGARIDADFKKRERTFEEMGTMFKTELLGLFEQLLPAFRWFINRLDESVQSFREWTESGEAMNNVISATIFAVGALTVALAPLALQMALVAAPFVMLYLLLEDFVGFMRGLDSAFGDTVQMVGNWLDIEDPVNKARKWFEELGDDILKFLDILSSPEKFGNALGSMFRSVYMEGKKWIGDLYEYIKTIISDAGLRLSIMFRSAMGDKLADLLNVPNPTQDKKDAMNARSVRDRGAIAGFADRMFEGNGVLAVAAQGLFGLVDSMANKRAQGDAAIRNGDASVGGFASSAVERLRALGQTPDPYTYRAQTPRTVRGSADAPQITNQITVQGSATPEVARQIGREAGRGTSVALGRDLSAIGAGVGVE